MATMLVPSNTNKTISFTSYVAWKLSEFVMCFDQCLEVGILQSFLQQTVLTWTQMGPSPDKDNEREELLLESLLLCTFFLRTLPLYVTNALSHKAWDLNSNACSRPLLLDNYAYFLWKLFLWVKPTFLISLHHFLFENTTPLRHECAFPQCIGS